jgi:lysophospholipase L1-like esterase
MALVLWGIHGHNTNVSAASYQAAKIAVVGSSTAAGAGATDYAHSWVGLYTAHLASLNPTNSVFNLAVGGYTTYHTLPTGTVNPPTRPAVDPNHNITTALATHPSAVIINLPSNDTANGYSESETETNYLIMAATCLASNVPVWIATTQPRTALATVLKTRLMNIRDWTITNFPTRYLDFWTTIANPDGTINATYNAGDGVHLNNAGHQVLYTRVVESRLYELVSAPRTLTLQPASETVEIGFDSLLGLSYALESSPDLLGWETATNINGDGSQVSLSVPATNAVSFFRLRLDPAP